MTGMLDLQKIADEHGTYPVEAYVFVAEGLRHASELTGKDKLAGSSRHLSAAELVRGCLALAATRYGLLARSVLRGWNLHRSEDVGAVTFHLIDSGILGKQERDRQEDFVEGPRFDRALEELVVEQVRGEKDADA